MNKTLTPKIYLPILLLVALVLFVPGVAFASVIHDFLFGVVTTVFGWLVFVGAMVLNYGINEFIIDFGQNYLTSGVGLTIEDIWATFRDLFNLTFIFGLVYVGFKMILRSDDSNTRKWLIQIIIAALLVNFSLFITKFVIDFSNILAVEIMNISSGPADAAPPGEIVIFPDHQSAGAGDNDIDLSASIAQATGVVTVSGREVAEGEATKPSVNSFTYIFGVMFLYIVTAFVFFSAGILLIIRGVVLLVLMIVSPFLFIGMVLPFLSGLSSKLWNTLFTRAFMAPIYVAILYIAMSVAQRLIGGAENFDEAFRGGENVVSSTANAFGPFIIVIVLLLMSLTVAQKLGAEGAGAMIQMGNNMRRRGQRAVANSARWTRNQTAGRAARYGSEKAGRGISRGLQRLQQVQGSGVIARATRAAARSNAVTGTVGAGAEAMQQTKFGLKRTREEERKMRNQTERKAEQGMGLTENLAVLSDSAKSTDELNKSTKELADIMKKMSDGEISDMSQDTLTNENVALNLKDSTIDSIEKSGTKTMDEVQAIRNAKKQAQINMAYTGSATVDNPEEKNPHLRTSSNAEMQRDGSVLGTKANDNRDKMRSRMFSNSKNVAEMPDEVFENPDTYTYVSPSTIQSKAANVDNATRVKMRDALLAAYGITPPPAGTPFTIAGSALAGTPWEKWADRSPEGARFFSG